MTFLRIDVYRPELGLPKPVQSEVGKEKEGIIGTIITDVPRTELPALITPVLPMVLEAPTVTLGVPASMVVGTEKDQVTRGHHPVRLSLQIDLDRTSTERVYQDKVLLSDLVRSRLVRTDKET
jgi:hypothetical protein